MQIDKLDSRDLAILNALQDNGRLTNTQLAEKVNLSQSACLRRLKNLEDSPIVSSYTVLLDPRSCGLAGTAFVMVTLEGQGKESLENFELAIRDIPEILECYLLAGQHDYMLRIIFSDSEDLERIHSEILTDLPGVVRVQSTLTLRTVKRTTKLPLQQIRRT